MNCYRCICYLGIFFTLSVVQCKKEQVPALFEIESETRVTFDAGRNTVDIHTYITPAIVSTFNAQLRTRNLDDEAVQAVLPQDLIIRNISNSTPLNFIQNITVRISKTNREEDIGKEIAYLEFVPLNTNSSLRLFPSLVDIREFVQEETFFIRVDFRARSFLQQNIETRIDMLFHAQ